VNVPVLLVIASVFVDVALLVTTTVAPGTTAPPGSVTTPVMVDVACACK
jgi:hypothetical protein